MKITLTIGGEEVPFDAETVLGDRLDGLTPEQVAPLVMAEVRRYQTTFGRPDAVTVDGQTWQMSEWLLQQAKKG